MMRIAMGHVDEFDDRTAQFARQLGLTSIQFHCPSNLDHSAGHWRTDDVAALVQQAEAHGLVVEGIENVPFDHLDKIMRGDAGRDEQIENYQKTIRAVAAAGVPTLGHHFMASYVWRTDLQGVGRGGSRVTVFDMADIGKGNALAAYKLTPTRAFDADLPAEMMRDNYRYFMQAVLPVAEEVGIRLCLHPDDPPISTGVGNVDRIFASPADLIGAVELAGNSPAWALNLCAGTVSEMAGEESVLQVIDGLASQGRIALVHFRDVKGFGDRFEETYLGDGNMSPARVIRRLAHHGFDGFIIDDHVPAMVGDVDTWGDTSSETYCSRGRAHAIGFLQGVMDAIAGDAEITRAR